jgi:Na+/H+ antiporter NhaD/arsenite permease-like protein
MLVIFVVVYAYLIIDKKRRAYAMAAGAVLAVVTGVIQPADVVKFINWNVMGIFAGTLILADLFAQSKVPALCADYLVDRSGTVGRAILLLCAASGLISTIVENVAVVLLIAPIALEIARKQGTSPVPFLIGIAISSNLQGTATLMGDPPSMIMAGYERLDFNAFFFHQGKLSIFFAVELGALFSLGVLHLIFRSNRQPVSPVTRTAVESWFPTTLLGFAVVGLALSPMLDPGFRWLGGTWTMIVAGAGLVWSAASHREGTPLRRYDYNTTLFLAGVFVVVGGLEESGLIRELAAAVSSAAGERPLVLFLLVVWGSVLLSAFIDNVPYITAMIPVTHQAAVDMGVNPLVMVFGLVVGACLGGNITPFGASANIVAVGMLKRSGHEVGFLQFVKIGLPFTLVSTAVGAAFIWFVWN